MAYILNRYNPSEFPGPTIRRPPYYELGPSVQIPNAPLYPYPFSSPWHADVSGLDSWWNPLDWFKGGTASTWMEFEKGVLTQKEGRVGQGWLAKIFGGMGSFFKGSFFGGEQSVNKLTTKSGQEMFGKFVLRDGKWYDVTQPNNPLFYANASEIATTLFPGTVGQGNLSKLFGAIGGALKDLFSKATSGGGTEPGPGGGTGTGTGTNQPKTIAGLDPNILLVIGALAIGGIFLIMSRPTSSGQPQIIMPEMFRPRRTYARKRMAPRKRSRTTSRRRR
jgi:hypothetical protein